MPRGRPRKYPRPDEAGSAAGNGSNGLVNGGGGSASNNNNTPYAYSPKKTGRSSSSGGIDNSHGGFANLRRKYATKSSILTEAEKQTIYNRIDVETVKSRSMEIQSKISAGTIQQPPAEAAVQGLTKSYDLFRRLYISWCLHSAHVYPLPLTADKCLWFLSFELKRGKYKQGRPRKDEATLTLGKLHAPVRGGDEVDSEGEGVVHQGNLLQHQEEEHHHHQEQYQQQPIEHQYSQQPTQQQYAQQPTQQQYDHGHQGQQYQQLPLDQQQAQHPQTYHEQQQHHQQDQHYHQRPFEQQQQQQQQHHQQDQYYHQQPFEHQHAQHPHANLEQQQHHQEPQQQQEQQQDQQQVQSQSQDSLSTSVVRREHLSSVIYALDDWRMKTCSLFDRRVCPETYEPIKEHPVVMDLMFMLKKK